jgi:blue copper oxidase
MTGLALALPAGVRSESPRAAAATTASDWCGAGNAGRPLHVPGASGFLGRLALDEAPLTLRAAPLPAGAAAGGLTQGYLASYQGRSYLNPTLVLRPGQRVRIDLDNQLDEATIVHWHGLTVDTRNDGAGMALAAPGAHYAYDFEVRSRGALYWYHPHPHGLTAGQAYRGLFGALEITDDDEAKLRAALDLVPGQSEIALVLQDRRGGDNGYAPSPMDQTHGFLGDGVLVNGTACPYLDVATRLYRFRLLNASNARTYRLAWRTASGTTLPFTLIGNDGGLLPAPQTCTEAFLATAERLDLLLDLSALDVGETLLLETRSFEPMHMEMNPPGGAMDHAAMRHGESLPEGSPANLLQLRIREKIAYAAKVPERLSTPPPIDTTGAVERPLRLGFAKGRWRINDRVFAMGETPIEVKRDTVETWLIRNYFNSMPHAMHLHGFAGQVLGRETSPDQLAALKIDPQGRLATDLGRKDTVLVWPGESVRVAFDFRCPFPGEQTYVFHCHNLEHEDGGMMLGVKVT